MHPHLSFLFHLLLLLLLLLPLTAAQGLRDAFTGGRYFGVFTNPDRPGQTPPAYGTLLDANFDAGTDGNACKWDSLELSPGVFSWGRCERTADWLGERGWLFRGHTLVWHNQLPAWVQSLQGADATDSAMRNHITTVMQHFGTRAAHWDVVNEAFNEDGSLRASVFRNNIGQDYIQRAFQYARAAQPGVKLYYNDYNIEGYMSGKQNGVYELVSGLVGLGVIDGVGFQGHFNIGQIPANLEASVERFTSLGLEVAFTELDIGSTTNQDFNQQARDFATIVSACVNVPGCVGITVAGIGDNESDWRRGETPNLWDQNYQPKPAVDTVAEAAAAGTS